MPQTDEILMIFPCLLCTIQGTAHRQVEKTEVRLVERMRFQSSISISVSRPMLAIPALLIKTSIPPKVSEAVCIISFTNEKSPISPRQQMQLTAQVFFRSAASASKVSFECAQFKTRLYPAAAKRRASAAPIPREAPVISTVLVCIKSLPC